MGTVSLLFTTNSQACNSSRDASCLLTSALPALSCLADIADYINFMKQVTPETTQEYMTQLKRFNMGAPGESDCPVFDGMYEYFAVSVSSSHWLAVGCAAVRLIVEPVQGKPTGGGPEACHPYLFRQSLSTCFAF